MPKSRTTKRVMYIERKTENGRFLNHRGPAWIAEVSFSKTGRTIYFKGLALQRNQRSYRPCDYGNCFVSNEGRYPDEYWVSGVKKRGSNRHWAGGGAVKNET